MVAHKRKRRQKKKWICISLKSNEPSSHDAIVSLTINDWCQLHSQLSCFERDWNARIKESKTLLIVMVMSAGVRSINETKYLQVARLNLHIIFFLIFYHQQLKCNYCAGDSQQDATIYVKKIASSQ